MNKQKSTAIESAVRRFHEIMKSINPSYYRYTASIKRDNVKRILTQIENEFKVSSNTICLIVGIV